VNARSSAARLVLFFAAAWLLFSFATIANAQKKHPPPNSVDLNSATAAELQQVPGIGPSTAKAIINFREKSGPFQRVEDLLAIRGISKQALERMRRISP
jgi:competence ComEA-like helix-hairpin-helix protein